MELTWSGVWTPHFRSDHLSLLRKCNSCSSQVTWLHAWSASCCKIRTCMATYLLSPKHYHGIITPFKTSKQFKFKQIAIYALLDTCMEDERRWRFLQISDKVMAPIFGSSSDQTSTFQVAKERAAIVSSSCLYASYPPAAAETTREKRMVLGMYGLIIQLS